eukprot:GHVS01090635.1.p1 GENE.GHVS01090635.1~~GHVS01090635.1.p1  ORF type:complete len:140 (+),score=10.29 GHVS01090635.1:25-444(+)
MVWHLFGRILYFCVICMVIMSINSLSCLFLLLTAPQLIAAFSLSTQLSYPGIKPRLFSLPPVSRQSPTHGVALFSVAQCPTVVAGVQPSGCLHLGNYLGALRNISDQKKYKYIICIADLHAATQIGVGANLSKNVLELG